MIEDKINALFTDDEFVKDLVASASYEEAQKKLADNDVKVSVDELKNCVNAIKKKESGEIADEELQNVSGGGFITFLAGCAVGGSVVTYLAERVIHDC